MTKALLALALAVAFAAAPAVAPEFTGFSPDQLPVPQVDPPVQPAGWAFSIWGVIYAWLIVSGIFGIWQRPDDAGWDAARGPLIVSLALGVPYLWVAVASPVGSTILIIAMLVTALAALLASPGADRWWLQAPVALYAGWLTAASWVSLAQVGAGYGLITGEVGWALIGIAGALVLASGVLAVLARAPEYAAPVVWALIGIIAKSAGGPLSVTLLAAVGIVALALAAWRAHLAASA